jgi:hypothetical protein
MAGKSVADVFIIESLKVKEEVDRKEGEIIYRTLRMSGKNPVYHYVRTERELRHFINEFKASRYRYLHISCHGNIDTFATTFDVLDDDSFSRILAPALNQRRLFLSTCLAATSPFAAKIFKRSRCYSVAGPVGEIAFDDSAILWTSFYHLMFKTNVDLMKNDDVKLNLSRAASILGERIRLLTPNRADGTVRSVVLPPIKRIVKKTDFP